MQLGQYFYYVISDVLLSIEYSMNLLYILTLTHTYCTFPSGVVLSLINKIIVEVIQLTFFLFLVVDDRVIGSFGLVTVWIKRLSLLQFSLIRGENWVGFHLS